MPHKAIHEHDHGVLNLVRAGMGVALLPRSAGQMRVNGVRFSDIRGPEAERDVGVAWNKLNESAVVRNFVQICLNHNEEMK